MKYLPEPDRFMWKQGSCSDYNMLITPYKNLEWTKIVAKYGIQVPEIVDMTMGTSKCTGCNRIYAGHQPYCTIKVDFHQSPSNWYPVRGTSHDYPVIEKECNAHLIWNLRGLFDEQTEFFSLLDKILCLPEPTYYPMEKFSSRFSNEAYTNLKVRLLEKDTEDKLREVSTALNTIASKMCNAGYNLIF